MNVFNRLVVIVLLVAGMIVLPVVLVGVAFLPDRVTTIGQQALSLLMALLTAGAGVFVSLKAATAQEAAQILTFAILIPPMLLQIIPLVFREQMERFLDVVDGPQLLVIVLAVLVVLDVAVLLAAVARFRRARLIV